jgi:hypothetical protein
MAGPRPKQRAYLKNAAELLQHVRNALRVIVLSPSLGKLASSSWRPYRPDNERRRSISNGLSKEVACAPVIAMTFALLPCPNAVVAMRLERRCPAESVRTIWITLAGCGRHFIRSACAENDDNECQERAFGAVSAGSQCGL